ncbi:MAG: AraC family transcriptional regulator [Alphaproteobacteria bacterium]|nr:AraC family transcriptional regulator [Alphaproteobacteria bacterium]
MSVSHDRLSAIINNFRVYAEVKNSPVEGGVMAGANFFVIEEERRDLDAIPQQWMMFYVGGVKVSDLDQCLRQSNAKIILQAFIDLGGGDNPIAAALPKEIRVPVDGISPVADVASLLIEEALKPRCGGQAVINRLCEVVMIRLFRHVIESSEAGVGVMAGLSHIGISKALVKIHEKPEMDLSLEYLASLSAMSRTHFANSFREIVGITPGQYVTNWRLGLARVKLLEGRNLKQIAPEIGFGSVAALTRAFRRHFGYSPKEAKNMV